MSTQLSRPPFTFISPPVISISSLRTQRTHHKLYSNYFPILTTRISVYSFRTPPRISAHFGRQRNSTSRRNRLREKIIEKQQVGGNRGILKDIETSSGIFVDSSEKTFRVDESVNGENSVAEAIGCLSEEEKLKLVKKSALLSKLESWAEQYKKDVESWGIGSRPIFTVFEDLGGNVEKVSVDEDEIRARGGFEEDLKEVNLRILHARLLANELESGKSVILRNSTVTKFVVSDEGSRIKGAKGVEKNSSKIEGMKMLADSITDVNDKVISKSELVEPREESGLVSAVRTVMNQPGHYSKHLKFGIVALSGLLVLWVVKSVIAVAHRGKLTILQEEESEETLKSDKDEMEKVNVEVVDVSSQVQKIHIRRPKLDKQELLKKMSKNKARATGNFQLQQSSSVQRTENHNSEKTFREIKDVAPNSREVEANNSSFLDKNETIDIAVGDTKVVGLHAEEATTLPDIQDRFSRKSEADFHGESISLRDPKTEDGIRNKVTCMGDDAISTHSSSVDVLLDDKKTMTEDDMCVKEPDEVVALVKEKGGCAMELLAGDQNSSTSSGVKPVSEKSSSRKKIRIIKSVKEARDYLSRKRTEQEPHHGREDLFTKEVLTSSLPRSEIPIINFKIDEAEQEPPAVAGHSMKMVKDSRPSKITGHSVNGDIGRKENSVMSQNHENSGEDPLNIMENQEPHVDDGVILNESTLVSWPHSGTGDFATETGNTDSGTKFSPHTAALALGTHASTEELEESNHIGNNHCTNNDIGKIQHSVISPKYDYPEGNSVPIFAEKVPPRDNENIFSEDGTFTNLQSKEDGYNGAIVPQDGMPSQIGNDDSTQTKKENEPTKDLHHKFAATFGLDSPTGNIASETNQRSKDDYVKEPPRSNDNWLEKNFHVLDPVAAKIRDGFKENYMVAQEKTEEIATISDLSQLESIEDDHELEWMKDDHLRDIVFKVRDNELSGREPFHMMSNEDQVAFFDGLQKKVEQENKKLLKVHEYVHSNVENLNYGADGISIYDPPEKVIPRWKGPPIEKAPEFLSKPVEQKDATASANVKNPPCERSRATSPLKAEDGAPKKPKIIIEGSDGSVKPGKKNGKEFWQHTKKWSRGFLELYNAETDPEMKATMKDIGKDLDRWITEKEIQEAAELIDKMPERNKEFIQKKVEKIKREMELFGPQAVVSKYREYSEEKEEDYLWWLDLPYVLCIELYTNEGGEQRVGFYSLEMATDMDLKPKPCHVIAFEDSKDCKYMCYIIQAHMEMLGSGHAFVVARPPKDTFRESKANGFNVTVIRKGELSLNIDQMLEEVEEQIVEIGSKMYHDQIMKDRSVDMNALMKGVIGENKPIKRKRSRRKKLKNIPTNIQ
uniref:Uncharacterized protein n=1 Tax=Kalanchoe fedtschenkoi TaxID=63787 RepID=A0A7N0UK75_KALFE